MLQAMIPCTQAQAEAKPVSIPFQFTMDAPIEVVWAKINDWSHDHSWVQGSQVWAGSCMFPCTADGVPVVPSGIHAATASV